MGFKGKKTFTERLIQSSSQPTIFFPPYPYSLSLLPRPITYKALIWRLSSSLYSHNSIKHQQLLNRRLLAEMATTSAVLMSSLTPVKMAAAQQKKPKVVNIRGLNAFGGLKAYNDVSALGVTASTEHCFAKAVQAMKSKGRSGGGALSSTCNAAAEIFQIAVTINGLTLVGVAIGFVLLRIEASVEEAEAE